MKGFLTLAELLAWIEYSPDLKARAKAGFGLRLLTPESAFPNDRPLIHLMPTGITIIPTREYRARVISFVAAGMDQHGLDAGSLVDSVLPFHPPARSIGQIPLLEIDQSAAAGNRLRLPYTGVNPHEKPSFILQPPHILGANARVPLELYGADLVATMPEDTWKDLQDSVRRHLSRAS